MKIIRFIKIPLLFNLFLFSGLLYASPVKTVFRPNLCEEIKIVYFGDSFSTDFSFHDWKVPFITDYLSHNYMRQWGSRSFIDGLRLSLKNRSPTKTFSIDSYAAVGARVISQEDRVSLLPEIRNWLDNRDKTQDSCTVIGIWMGHNDLDWLKADGESAEEKIQDRLEKYRAHWRSFFRTIFFRSFSGKVVIFTQANHDQRTIGYESALKIHHHDPSRFDLIEVSQRLLPEGSEKELREHTLELARKMDQFLLSQNNPGVGIKDPTYLLHISTALNAMDYTSPTILTHDAVHFRFRFLYQLGIKAGEALL